jgi:YidC/Oxa1 family membrane protein insertase
MVKNQPMGQASPMMQQQKILLYVFPLMFAIFGINFPIGVLVYWLTTNIWTMGQQLIVIRRNPTPGSEADVALQKRRADKAAAKAQAQALAAGSPVIEDESTQAKGQRQQPKRASRSQRSRGTPGAKQQTAAGEVAAEPPSDS